MKPPNFFIVGAPKCGSGSLWTYLKSHPKCFMTTPKEPDFFSKDIKSQRKYGVKSWDQYNKLFAGATDEHLMVGEASTKYLRSQAAIKTIRERYPDAKILALLRNPVDLVYSLHLFAIGWGMQKDVDLESLWKAPASGKSEYFIEIAKLGEQVERMLKIFPEEQVKMIVFDDLQKDPKAVYEEVLSFLGLPSDHKMEFQQINAYTKQRAPKIRRMAAELGCQIKPAVSVFKKIFGIRRIGLMERVRKWNTVPAVKKPLSPEFRAELVEVFREDVDKLSRILNRDLSHWHQ